MEVWVAPWRAAQAMLFAQLADDKEEASAKKSLAVLTELYRRNVWTDARTVNVSVLADAKSSQRVTLRARWMTLRVLDG
jgi:protein SDA1